MKTIKLFTVAMLIAASATTFTSCGGGTSEKTESAADVKPTDGLSHVKQVTLALENGDIKMDKATSKDITKFFGFEDDDDEYLFDDNSYDGYRLDKSFSMNEGVLNSVSYSTFYDKGNEEDAEKDTKAVFEMLKKELGDPKSGDVKSATWEKKNYDVSFSSFDDGYSYYINSHIEKQYDEVDPVDGDNTDDQGCVGDFYGLKDDLSSIFMAKIKSGDMKLGKSTKSDMKNMTGDENTFNKEYDGLSVSSTYGYNGDGKLESISLNYFYNTCGGAKSLLEQDKKDIETAISNALGVDGTKDGDYENAGTYWEVGNQKIKQANFTDGYSIFIDVK